jgi:hypothetical protein
MLKIFEAYIIQIIGITWLPLAIVGGIVSHKKGDYFSRGLTMISLTWAFGLIFLLKAPRSKAKEGDQDDLKNWHMHAAIGGMWMFVLGILYIFIRTVFLF